MVVCIADFLANDLLQEIDGAVAVAPLVVIPTDQLEEALVKLDAAAGVEDRRVRVVDEVRGDHLVGRVGEDALEISLAGVLHRGADFLVAGVLHGLDREIDHGDGRRRHAE